MPSTPTSEAGVLDTLGILKYTTAEVYCLNLQPTTIVPRVLNLCVRLQIAKLRELLREDKQLVFKNREVSCASTAAQFSPHPLSFTIFRSCTNPPTAR